MVAVALAVAFALPHSARAELLPKAQSGQAATAHLQRANELLAQDQLAAACSELEAAYQGARDPMLWLRIGRLRLRLHQQPEARAAMQRFIDEAVDPHPALKAEAQRALHELMQAKAPPLPPVPPPGEPGNLTLYHDLRMVPVIIKTERDRRLLKIGGLLLAGGYLPALAVSIGYASSVGQPDAPSAAANFTLLIPVLGPFVSAIVAPTTASASPRPLISSWSVPWAVTSGLVQAAGLATLIVGALPRRVPVLAAQLQVRPYASPAGSGLWAVGKF